MRRQTGANGWWQTASLGVIAALLRLPDLGRPHAVVFDETYYAKDAWSLLHAGYELVLKKNANELMLAGNSDILTSAPEYVVHPPVGKWVIAIGEYFFGLNPFGWRISVALLGIIAVLLVHRVARRLFRNELVAWLAGLFMAIDGLAIVLSRTALLDQMLMAFTLAGFAAIVADRDRTRRRLSAGLTLGFRWQLLLAALLLGLALGTKWSAAWFIVASGLLAIFFTARTRISLGQSRAWVQAFWWDTLPYLPLILLIIGGTYLAGWSGWLLSTGGWGRQAASGNGGWVPEALQALLQYHQSAWNFHVHLTSPHSYAANPWTWPLQLRPTSFYYESFQRGQAGCNDSQCAAEVLAIGNPVIWWAGTVAVLHQAWRAVKQRETRALAIGLMYLAGWLPWMPFQQRTVFSFYSIVMLPYLVLALAGSLGVWLGEANAGGRVRSRRAFAVGGLVLLIVVVSGFFLPHWTGQTVSYWYWQLHMWLPNWI